MRHECLLDKKGEDGETWQAHLEETIRRGGIGSVKAQRDLDGPGEPPDTILYLAEWAYALCGRSGSSMAGIGPLSYGTIAEWSGLMGIDPTPLEVQALIVLDAVIRNPEINEPKPDAIEAVIHAWPEKKSDG